MPMATTSDVYADDSAQQPIATLHTLRQQMEKREGRFNTGAVRFHRAA